MDKIVEFFTIIYNFLKELFIVLGLIKREDGTKSSVFFNLFVRCINHDN